MKHLSLKQAMDLIENEPLSATAKKKTIVTLWPLIRPFVVMLSTVFGFSAKIKGTINSFIAAIDAFVAAEAKKAVT